MLGWASLLDFFHDWNDAQFLCPSQLTVDKANKSDHLADNLDPTFIIDNRGKLLTRLSDKCDDLISALSIFHSFPATYHPAFLWCIDLAAHEICTMLLTP